MSRKKITLPLVDGRQYLRGDGKVMTVMGPTKDYPDWVWTVQGEWYRRSDGRWISYELIDRKGPRSGPYHHIPNDITTWRDLKEDA